jgi:hypothetical protein
VLDAFSYAGAFACRAPGRGVERLLLDSSADALCWRGAT